LEFFGDPHYQYHSGYHYFLESFTLLDDFHHITGCSRALTSISSISYKVTIGGHSKVKKLMPSSLLHPDRYLYWKKVKMQVKMKKQDEKTEVIEDEPFGQTLYCQL
jgi:hypothetical protein